MKIVKPPSTLLLPVIIIYFNPSPTIIMFFILLLISKFSLLAPFLICITNLPLPVLFSATSRFVMHVKRGVYKENFEIGKKMKNIMLASDGLTYTIITGSRSVGGGFTTFNSATVGI